MGSRFGALIMALFVWAGSQAEAACKADELWLRGPFGEARFFVDLAQSPEERSQGLMFVDSMPSSHGMLFVYPDQAPRSFWMKNTLIPLDMVFADATGTVIHIHENAKPGDLSGHPSNAPAQYVLEINGGLSSLLGIKPGAQMRHPTITEPAWPCL